MSLEGHDRLCPTLKMGRLRLAVLSCESGAEGHIGGSCGGACIWWQPGLCLWGENSWLSVGQLVPAFFFF